MNLLASFVLLAAQDPSLLIVLLDDVGAEFLEFHPMGVDAGNPASTPTLSALADEGLQFTSFWSAPECSPTRAALLTGRLGHRTGVGTIIEPQETFGLALTEVTLAERLKERGFASALFGKWHLSNEREDVCDQGFERWSGSLGNLGAYERWERTDDTSDSPYSTCIERAYATTSTTDEALGWIQAQEGGGWFALVAYNAPHKPYHIPPGCSQLATEDEMYRAALEVLDSEIGRLLAGIDLDETTVLVLGDNGSPHAVAQWPNAATRTKREVYRGGVVVPCIAAGRAVRCAVAAGENQAGQELAGHGHVVDIFETALRLMPGDEPPRTWPAVDSLPLYDGRWRDDLRDWNFTERAVPLGAPFGGPYSLLRRAVEERGYKAVWKETGAVELYAVLGDPWETFDLLADGVSAPEQAILDGLSARLGELNP